MREKGLVRRQFERMKSAVLSVLPKSRLGRAFGILLPSLTLAAACGKTPEMAQPSNEQKPEAGIEFRMDAQPMPVMDSGFVMSIDTGHGDGGVPPRPDAMAAPDARPVDSGPGAITHCEDVPLGGTGRSQSEEIAGQRNPMRIQRTTLYTRSQEGTCRTNITEVAEFVIDSRNGNIVVGSIATNDVNHRINSILYYDPIKVAGEQVSFSFTNDGRGFPSNIVFWKSTLALLPIASPNMGVGTVFEVPLPNGQTSHIVLQGIGGRSISGDWYSSITLVAQEQAGCGLAQEATTATTFFTDTVTGVQRLTAATITPNLFSLRVCDGQTAVTISGKFYVRNRTAREYGIAFRTPGTEQAMNGQGTMQLACTPSCAVAQFSPIMGPNELFGWSLSWATQ